MLTQAAPLPLPNSLHLPNYLKDGTVAFFRDVVSGHGGDRLTVGLDDHYVFSNIMIL